MRHLIALLGLIAAASGAPGATPPRDLARESKIAAKVSAASALSTVRELVAHGPRMGGTQSGDRAAAAVAATLRGLGLGVEVIEDPPQPTHEASSWLVALGDHALASAWPWNFSPALARATAELRTFPGAIGGGEATLDGAVVLVGGAVTSDLYATMVKAGAIALLTDAPGDPNRFADWAPIETLKGVADGPAPIPVFGLSYRDGRLLRGALAADAARTPRVTVSLAARLGHGRPRTVIGTLPGSGARSGGMVILCAHGDSDSGGPGADDNASGVASLIEVARALSAAASEGTLPPSRPQVRFIVWGAEYHSSRAWVLAHPGELGRIEAVINYDETGFGAERDAVYFEGNDVPGNAALLRTLESVAEDHAGEPGFPSTWTSNPSQGGTDAYVFLPRRYHGLGLSDATIPSTTVFAAAWGTPTRRKQIEGWTSKGWPEPGDLFIDYSPYYHSSGDVPERTTEAEPWNVQRCATVVAVAIYRLMEAAGGR